MLTWGTAMKMATNGGGTGGETNKQGSKREEPMERMRHCGIQVAGFRVLARAKQSFPQSNPR
jgi:hypothetical protein